MQKGVTMKFVMLASILVSSFVGGTASAWEGSKCAFPGAPAKGELRYKTRIVIPVDLSVCPSGRVTIVGGRAAPNGRILNMRTCSCVGK